MTTATGILDNAELEAAVFGGLVNEDVMQRIYDISPTEVKFTDDIGDAEKAERSYKEWTIETLASPNLANALIDGQDIVGTATNAAAYGTRVGNHCQESGKLVQLSTRGQAVNSIGNVGKMVRQLARRQQELKRDIEAIMLTDQASVADTGPGGTAGKSGGFFAWVETNASGGATGSNGGFNTSTGVVDAPSAGTTRALSETLVRDACEDAYNAGGNPTVFMSVPSLCRKFSEYLFTSSARIATLTSDVGQSTGGLTANGTVSVFVSDFGIALTIKQNRIMQPKVATGGSRNVYAAIYDPEYLGVSWLKGIMSEKLAKTGLYDNHHLICDWTLVVLNEAAHAAIRDIDDEATVTA